MFNETTPFILKDFKDLRTHWKFCINDNYNQSDTDFVIYVWNILVFM